MKKIIIILFLFLSPLYSVCGQQDSLNKIANHYLKAEKCEQAASVYLELFKSNKWKGSIDMHLSYAEALAQLNQFDSAFLHINKVVKHPLFDDYKRITKNINYQPLHNEEVWIEITSYINSQTSQWIQPLTDELEQIYEDDQALRLQLDSIINEFGYPSKAYERHSLKINKLDSINQVKIERVFEEYGWPDKSNLSIKANRAIFLVIQHASPSYQNKYSSTVKQAHEQGNIDGQDYAMFIDRQLMYNNEPQIYGTQLQLDENTGLWKLYPVKDLETVDQKRKEMGLIPLDQFLKSYGINVK